MPAVTPKRSSKRDTYFRSYKKFDASYWMNDYSMNRSVGLRSLTMYDKVFLKSARKCSNKITKNYSKHRVSEIERCTNLAQREQYRLLIARYCNTSLAETEKIFCKGNSNQEGSAKENLEPSTIVISDTPISKVFRTQPQPNISSPDRSFMTDSVPSTAQPNYVAFARNDSSPLSSLTEKNPKTQDAHDQAKLVRFSSTSTPQQSSSLFNTPKSSSNKQRISDWLSPTSPYLSSNFIRDLNSSYGRRERERKKKVQEEETRARLLKEKREMKEEKLSKLLEERLRVKPVAEVVIPELTEDQEEEVDHALIAHPQQQVLREKFNISITRQHIGTLAGLNWLNDEVINFYMELIVERSNTKDDLPSAHAMNTFFYPKLSTQGFKSVRRWTKRVDIFSKDLIFYPIHLGIHWTLAVVDFRVKTIAYFDSMGGINLKCLEILKSYLVSESEDKKKTTLDVSDWKLINKTAEEIPQQLNGSDCGVFTCTFAEFLSRNASLSFHQDHMPLIRRTMVWEIVNGLLTR